MSDSYEFEHSQLLSILMEELMRYLISFCGLLLVFALALLVSKNKKEIKYKNIVLMLVIQFLLATLLLNTTIGYVLIKAITNVFDHLLSYANAGISFVFGGLANQGESPFFLTVLLPIVFISALIGILQHFKILPFFMTWVGFLLSKINGMGKLESYNAVASAMVGQSEVFITVKKQLDKLSPQRMYTLCASAMSTVSMSVVGAYMTMIEPKYVVTAIVLNLFGGFIIVSIINPYKVEENEDILTIEDEQKQAFFQMLGEYIMDGFKVAIIVGAMLIGFVALMDGINSLFDIVIGVSFQEILGYIFAPIAFLMGVPWADAITAGGIMATKLVTNEFVAMISLGEITDSLSERTLGIISVFLVSFANFSSIGIIAGAVKGLNERQGNIVARFGLKLLYGATLVSILTAIVVGLII